MALVNRRGWKFQTATTAEHDKALPDGELSIDTDKKVVVTHDGATVGGTPMAKESDLAGKADDPHGNEAHNETYITAADIPAIPADFTDLDDTPSAYTGEAGKYVKVKATEDGLEFDTVTAGAGAFTDLTDTPANFTGAAGKAVTVNSAANALEYGGVPVFLTEAGMYKLLTYRNSIICDFQTYDMWNSASGGSGVNTQALNWQSMQTGATAGSWARQNFNRTTRLYAVGYLAFNLDPRYAVGASNVGVTFVGGNVNLLGAADSTSTNTSIHAGFYNEDGTWYASTGNGTAQEKTALSPLAFGVYAIYNTGTAVHFFDTISGAILATHTTFNFAALHYVQFFVHNKTAAENCAVFIFKMVKVGA